MWKLLLVTCFAAATAIFVDTHYPGGRRYNFVYAVHDPLTHDIKNQWETRVGDRVQGSYRLLETDGTVRIVDYYADGQNGFRATVRREGQAYHQVALPIQSHQIVVPVRPLQSAYAAPKRDYFGATFVREKNYGRGLGYL